MGEIATEFSSMLKTITTKLSLVSDSVFGVWSTSP